MTTELQKTVTTSSIKRFLSPDSPQTSIISRVSQETEKGIFELETFNETKLAELAEGMPEIHRATRLFGKSDTSITRKLMTLTMMQEGGCPYKTMKQCLSQIESRREALKENLMKRDKNKLRLHKLADLISWEEQEIEYLQEDIDKITNDETLTDREKERKTFPLQKEIKNKQYAIETFNIEGNKLIADVADGNTYIEGAYKEIAMMKDAYEEIRKNHNIPEDWDELDMEMAEVESHVRQVFVLAFRNMVEKGRVSGGELEYINQFGLHPLTVMEEARSYIMECEQKAKADYNEGSVKGDPQVLFDTLDYEHFQQWLDRMVEKYKENYKQVMSRLGITTLSNPKFLTIEKSRELARGGEDA